MNEPCNPKPSESDTTLRDNLAALRTVLANERTLLAYIRTALSFMAAGAFFVKFVNTGGLVLVGWFLIPAGLVTLCLGAYRFKKTHQALNKRG